MEKLINRDELVREWIAEGTKNVQALPADTSSGDLLTSLQVTTRSPMGALAYVTGGLLVDDGWLRIRGSGHELLPRSLDASDHQTYGYMVIADDAIGGFYALNGGALGEDLGNVYYASPDTTEWESLDAGYSDFLSWCFTDGLDGFYEGLRWSTWKEDIKALKPDQCFGFYPFLWSDQGDVETASRKALPVIETWNLRLKFIEEIG